MTAILASSLDLIRCTLPEPESSWRGEARRDLAHGALTTLGRLSFADAGERGPGHGAAEETVSARAGFVG
jgi:hypothetical protein